METAPEPIDLRSDTVTRPTPGMRAAMAAAPVGDDQYGEDPTVNALQARVADLLGKEAALWIPTGTMADHVAHRVLTRPGDEVIVSRQAHTLWHEAGSAAMNAGIQLTEVGSEGVFTVEDLLTVRKPAGQAMYPPTTLVEIEDTHNRAGGVAFPPASARAICAAARDLGIATFLDGARLFNAALVDGVGVRERAAPFDLVAISLSKGLGAPAGSVLAGGHDLIERAVRFRRVAGGAMRQVGILAAAGLYALDHHVERLAVDHANAAILARRLAASPGVILDPGSVQTNIVMFRLADGAPDGAALVARARALGVLVNAIGPRTIRAVTHLDVSAESCARAGERLARAVESGVSPG